MILSEKPGYSGEVSRLIYLILTEEIWSSGVFIGCLGHKDNRGNDWESDWRR